MDKSKPTVGISTPATVTVGRTILKQQTTKQDCIEIRPFRTAPMRWKISLGKTINTGTQFEFVRIDVGIDFPCYVEEAVDGYNQALEMVRERLGAELEEIDRLIKGE
jgi:hypothetical protein